VGRLCKSASADEARCDVTANQFRYPAGFIVVALPGAHNTAWVHSIDFEANCMQRLSTQTGGGSP
jgi:hypothetical protein